MKNILIYTLLLSIVIMGCSNDSEEEVSENACMSAKVDGVNRIFNSFIILTQNDEVITIHGYNKEEKVGINLTIKNAVGLYNHQDTNMSAKFFRGNPFDFFDQDEDGPTIEYDAINGSVEITDINSIQVKGVFQFTAESYDGEKVIVSHGAFNCKKPQH